MLQTRQIRARQGTSPDQNLVRRRVGSGASTATIALILLSGCAGDTAAPAEKSATHQPSATPATPGAPQEAGGGPALEALRRSAALQAASPDRSSPLLPIPPGLSATDAAPISDPPGAPARLALDEVLKQFDGPLPNSDNPPKSEPPSEDSRRQALRLYASARSRLYRGDSGGAIVDLESATRLDPMASAPWRELGEAQLQQGKRASAMQSFQQAVRRGCREARILWLLGRDALRSGRSKDAVEYLAAARAVADDDGDPALPNVIDTELAEALRRLGYLRASAEAMADGLSLPDQFGATRMRVEVGELLRRRGDLYRELGDALCRLGDYPAALDAYNQSEQLPTLDPAAVIPRQIYAYMKLGRPAQAAIVLVEQINSAGGRADERVLALIPYVAASPTVAKDLAGAIGELAALLREDVSPTVADRLVRAQAAAARPEEARVLLRRHVLSSDPFGSGTAPALWQLLSTFERNDTDGRVRELVALIAESPAHSPLSAAALLNSPANLDRALTLLPAEGGSDAQTLLRAYLLTSEGLTRQAADLVTNRKWTAPFAAAGAYAETTLNAQVGRWDLARAAFDRPALKAASPGLARLRARAALNLQRPREALDTLTPLVDPTTGADRRRLDDLLDAGRLSALLDDAKGAEKYFNRAAEADPFDERSYDGLLGLYGPGGLLADASKLGNTARSLRDSCPSSRSLRLNAADEMAQRQIDGQAEQMLIDLVEEDLSDSEAGSMLVSVWDQRAQSAKTAAAREVEKPRLERAEAWLRARIVERPEQPWLWGGLARTLAAQGRAEEAVTLLEDRLKVRPWPALAQSREALLRDQLNRAQEADRLALERLEPMPRSLEASIELADLYVRLSRSKDAAAVLREAIPQGIALSDSQTARLVLLLLRVSQGTTGVAADAAGAGALFDVVAERTLRLPPQLHETRLAILTSRPDPNDRAITEALDLAVRQHPSLAANFYARVAAAFDQPSDRVRQAKAIPYLRLAVEKSAAPGLPIMATLVRLTVVVGSAEDLRLLIEGFDDPERIAAVLRELFPGVELKLPPEPDRVRAEFAYTLGNVLGSQDRRELANEAYRLAIGLDPGHAWAKNNLGYELVESNGDLDEAARLLEAAYAALPSESSVIDSLAWLRYKQGIFADQSGPEGKVVREGAITLLERAAATEKGSINATIFDHLGDALWAGGKPDEAAKAWARASTIAEEDLAKIRKDPRSSKASEEAAAKALRAILSKQKSLADGQEPAIAPPYWQPLNLAPEFPWCNNLHGAVARQQSEPPLAGHNKWSKVKHRKAAVEKRRGKVWTKIAKAMIVAAKNGGPDPDSNLTLRYAIDEARYANMPRDTIERAIKKGAGAGAGENYEPVRYEGYGPGGAAVLVDTLTDNRARTVGDLRLAFGKHGGNVGNAGCVAYLFDPRGQIIVKAAGADEDKLLGIALDAGALDVETPDDSAAEDAVFVVLSETAGFQKVKEAIERAGYSILEAQLAMIPQTRVVVRAENASQNIALVEALEELDDVQKVYANFDIPDEELAALER